MKKIFILVLAWAVISCAKKEAEIWYCPMHKDYQTDHPGDCPICGMKLVKKDASVQLPPKMQGATGAHAGTVPSSPQAANPPEVLSIPPDKQQMLGMRTTKPEMRKLALTLRLPAQVAYEPDLYTAIVEYRQLVSQASSMPEGISGASLVGAAALRVKQLGLGDDEIRQFSRSGNALSRLLTGNAAGQSLISLQVSEGEIGLIRKGLPVVVTASAYAEKKFKGQITGIGTLVDAKRRVFTVRALVGDAGALLRAQMFVTAEISLSAGKGLSLPRTAVYDTGTRQVVFVKKSETEFAPVEVKILGGNDDYAILSGITEKDEAVISSAFLLDSEARLKIGNYK